MASSQKVDNATYVTAKTNKFQNLTPIKGSVYGSNGSVYTKLPVGVNDDALTSDSTQAQGLIWKPYFNTSNPTVTFNLFSCIGWNQGNTYYCSWGTNPPAGNHANPNVISFNFDTYVLALGFKPRASTNSGEWSTPYPGGMWTGFLNLDVVGWADGVNPYNVAPTVMSPAAPHFSIQDTAVTSQYMAYNSIRAPGTEIFIPARTKFTIRSTWNASIFRNTNDDKYGTGNLILRGIMN